MERVTFKNSRKLNLVGNLHKANSKSIIIMCHGFTSDKYSRGRFEKLAKVFNILGYNALAFDFSGCGESDDDSLSVDKEVDDLKCAIKFVKDRGYNEIGLYGHSLGTLICLKSFTDEIKTMVLSGALTDSMKYDWDKEFTREQMAELKEKSRITVSRPKDIRKNIIIDKQALIDFKMIDQKELLKDITCSILIIHGNNDEEERLLLEMSKRGMELLSKDSKLEVIHGADHRFMEHFDILTNLASDWYLEHMPILHKYKGE